MTERLIAARSSTRILVTGSRDWPAPSLVMSHLDVIMAMTDPNDLVIVHGACPSGGDAMARHWAHNRAIAEEGHPAEDHGRWPSCGPLRNAHMVSLGARLCLAFVGPCRIINCTREPGPHGSHGTMNCVDLATRAKIPVVEVVIHY